VEVAQESGYIGRRERRIDGARLLTGRARFVADLRVAHALHLAIVRSPLPHAVISGVDVEIARSMSGVRAAVSGADLALRVKPIPPFIDPRMRGAKYVDVRCLATERTTYVGQPLAAVVASTQDEALAAARSVRLDLEPLPALFDAELALAAGAPLLYEEWRDNLLLANRHGTPNTAVALANAPRILEGELALQRCTTAPIEPRACIAAWDADEARLTVHSTCQNPHILRWMLATALGLRERDVRVVVPRVGGSFGLKMAGHPEDVLVAALARLTESAVRWVEDRAEGLKHGAREQRHRYRVGFDETGRILAFEDRVLADAGSATAQAGWAMPNLTGLTLPSGYDITHSDVEVRVAVTNKPPLAAARGFGKDGAQLVMERAVDDVAAALNIDPAIVRRRNFIPPDRFPYRMASGLNIDSGDYTRALDLALEAASYRERRAIQEELRRLGRFPGIGMAFELTPESADGAGTQVTGFDTATVRIDPDGEITVLTGVTTPGGGNETGIAQIVAQELGVNIGAVHVVQGDTDRTPYGFGNFSGRSLLTGGGAAALAARDLRIHLLRAAAAMLAVPVEGLRISEGLVANIDGSGAALSLAEIATAIATRAFQAIGDIEPWLEVTRSYKPGNIRQTPDDRGRIQPYPTYSNAVMVVLLEVDAGTGVVDLERIVVVHDCGTMINPALVEGQMHGAIAMGIGIALTEQLAFVDGALWSDRFKRYRLPRASDMPEVTVIHHVTPSPFTIFGNKGAGEAGVGGTAAAIVNGVVDALRPVGFVPRRLPLDPPALRAALAAATRDGRGTPA
jgi:carbon-monoxide dehydrogenase large subunit